MSHFLRFFLPKRTALIVIIALFVCVQTGATSQLHSYRDLIGSIGEARSKACSRVAIAKQKFSANSDEFIQAEKLYADAFSAYGHWDNDILSALKDGTKLDRNDPSYKQHSEDATQKTLNFLDYVNTKTSLQSKSAVAVISAFLDLGFNTWSKISDLKEKKKQAAIADFVQGTKWQSWGEIPTNGTCPQ